MTHSTSLALFILIAMAASALLFQPTTARADNSLLLKLTRDKLQFSTVKIKVQFEDCAPSTEEEQRSKSKCAPLWGSGFFVSSGEIATARHILWPGKNPPRCNDKRSSVPRTFRYTKLSIWLDGEQQDVGVTDMAIDNAIVQSCETPLAIIKIPDHWFIPKKQPVTLCGNQLPDTNVGIIGYEAGQDSRLVPYAGYINDSTGTGTMKLYIASGIALKDGYSGSPVLNDRGRVFAVVETRVWPDQATLRSVEGLRPIAKHIPVPDCSVEFFSQNCKAWDRTRTHCEKCEFQSTKQFEFVGRSTGIPSQFTFICPNMKPGSPYSVVATNFQVCTALADDVDLQTYSTEADAAESSTFPPKKPQYFTTIKLDRAGSNGSEHCQPLGVLNYPQGEDVVKVPAGGKASYGIAIRGCWRVLGKETENRVPAACTLKSSGPGDKAGNIVIETY